MYLWESESPDSPPSRTCKECGGDKAASDFYPGTGRCKGCVCRKVRENRADKREQYSAYEQGRFKRPERKAQMLEAQRRRRAAHPEKNRARDMVAKALRSGKLIKGPCEVCGTAENVQAHHDDYSKPLEVRWMCFKHHREKAHGQVVVVT
jgi:hypothetical protein